MLSLKRLSLFTLLTFFLGLLSLSANAQWFSSSSNQDEFLPVMEAFQPTAWHDGDTLYIGMDIADEYYLYRHQFAVVSQTENASLGDPIIPEGIFTNDEFMGDVYVFRDQVVLEVPLEAPFSGPLNIALTFQGCADAGLCYPPEQTTLEASETQPPSQFADWQTDSKAVSSSTANSSQQNDFTAPQSEDSRFSALISDASLPLALGLFFIAGLGLTFTPCVLPMIPILSSIVVGQNPTRPRAFALSLSYVLGMALTYALVGVLMGLFGAGLNLQAHLQSAPVLITFAVLFTLFALAMFGAFNLNMTPRFANRVDAWQARAQRSGPAGLALAGALSVLVVSPCVTAPLAGALVFISSTGDAAMGGSVLFALGMGMGVPLLLVGTFGTTLLPRSGAWMNGVKIAFGLLLLGVAIWMIERLVAAPIALLLWAALAIGTALALGALSFNQPQGWPRARQTLGLLLLAWGIVLVIGAAQGGSNPLRPLAATSSISGEPQTEALDFIKVNSLNELEATIAQAEGANQPAFVHFTADWCISCKLLERDVYPDPQVSAALRDYTLIAADVTHTDSQSRELLNQFNLFGPPSLLFFSQGEEIRDARIQGEVTANQLREHLELVSQWLANS
ncbi:protein-disulfide reductase DsbD [Vreelandella neptunia]|uniref:Thiol:disulfide interchange protein DsbD n=1 Tax=Vreelandella neptunia TaxID=115551 RepID=A0ABZ0YR60_9GAMM|nr:protein-disulfide reductase DsbD [Halomonas neptunia]MDN3561500.1 protein-disulfide reductase DsbD [Halomonas neptunia]TDV99531.1 thiol:disulfide interchange protein DsbD [Halomonas alkaliantarctica]WQH14650.1 protein-disulfide reductase DsbD [Halomonas neptunia]